MFRLLSIAIECISSAVFVIPAVLIWQYKIAKQKNFQQLLVLFLFVFYMIAVFSVTGIPTVDALNTIDFSFNLIPFIGIINDTTEYIKNSILNVILFMPMGFLLPVLWKEYDSLKKIASSGLILSLSIELLQIFTFRLTDIDDIITNTTGAIIGYFIFKLISSHEYYHKIELKINKISGIKIKKESIMIIILAFLISFLLKPLVSSILWIILLESPLWEKIK